MEYFIGHLSSSETDRASQVAERKLKAERPTNMQQLEAAAVEKHLQGGNLMQPLIAKDHPCIWKKKRKLSYSYITSSIKS